MRNVGKEFTQMSNPVALFSLFRLRPRYKWWAFRQMGLAKQHLSGQGGMRFGQMLGTGKGRGFSLWPDLRRYALFTCWDTEEQAQEFLATSSLYESIHFNSEEVCTMELQPLMSKGQWQGQQPFEPLAKLSEAYEGPLVVLTRARIRLSKAFQFWRHVAGVSRETGQAAGLLAQTGVGELPLIEQGTISIWKNEESLNTFAYGMHRHKEVIRKTREQGWYSEELFARFRPLSAEGSWDGRNPLQDYMPFRKSVSKEMYS